VSLLSAVKRANEPGPPENSVLFRLAATATVVVGIAACWSEGELSPTVAVGSMALVVVGNVFSYRRRANPLPGLKAVLAVAVTIAFLWFFLTVSRPAVVTSLATVEGPLAVLFTFIQVTHAFDVPSRRDLGFSLAGSATLMAAAAAQAIDVTFALYVVVWAAFGVVGLAAMWSSMVGGARVRPGPVALTGLAVLVVAVLVVAVLPATHASSTIVFPSTLAGDVPLSTPASLVGGGKQGTQPVQPAQAGGRIGVGGFLGFAGPLDTAVRGQLSDQVVFRVRADRPTFWLAETFNEWDGQSWAATAVRPGASLFVPIGGGPPFTLPLLSGELHRNNLDIQTFYIAVAGPNLIFHAANAAQVWFPAPRLFMAPDGTMRAGTSLGVGSVYTVGSEVNTATPAQLVQAGSTPSSGPTLTPAEVLRYTQLPHAYPEVAALARSVTAHAPTVYDKVAALETWIRRHTVYTTDIPPLRRGQDAVEQFLFGSRRGYCEQISTALAVMLRTLDIPAREAAGYVPGPYNPLTDLYDVQAKDAHAWVQVWFPTYGWQSFDPTALVPDANPSPGAALVHEVADVTGRIPPVPVGVVAVLVLAGALLWRRQRRAPKTWTEAMSRELEEAARRAGLDVDASEALSTLGRRLEVRFAAHDPPAPGPAELARATEAAAFGPAAPDEPTRTALLAAARRLTGAASHLPPAPDVTSGPGPTPPRSSPRQPAAAGRP